MTSIQERFESKVEKIPFSNCHWWVGATSNSGYGWFYMREGSYSAHRYSYMLYNGAIPDGKHVLHSCDNPLCVNPAHLSLGTHADNMREMASRGRCRAPKGEKAHFSKLSPKDVKDIKKSYPSITMSALADFYDVNISSISRIINGQNWKSVK